MRSESRNMKGQDLMNKGKQMYSRHANASPVGGLPGSRPPSGRATGMNGLQSPYKQIDHDPPLIRRGVTSDEYSLHRLNLHQEFQGRKGHLKVNSNTRGYEQPIR